MKQEIKDRLVAKLKEKGDQKAPPFHQHPVIHVLIEVLREDNPDVFFGDLDNVIARKKQSELYKQATTEEERKKVPSMRGEGWNNIMKLSGLNRIDFYLDTDVAYRIDEAGGLTSVPIKKYSASYKHCTIGSARKTMGAMSYREMAVLIERHYTL